MKYILETPVRGEIGSEKFKTAIHRRNGILITHDPEKLGGKDVDPDPYTLLLSSLVSCTLATLRLYIDHKGLEIPEIKVEANMFHRIEKNDAFLHIDRKIVFKHVADPELQQRLIWVAENCPVSKILRGNINIQTEFK